jgi:hypothetical protein
MANPNVTQEIATRKRKIEWLQQDIRDKLALLDMETRALVDLLNLVEGAN